MAAGAASPEQLKSREEVQDFLSKVKRPVQWLKGIKSEWFGRPDDELKGWTERGRAIEEIKATLGYRLIMEQTHREIMWAQNQLEVCNPDALLEMRCYLKCLRFLEDFILTTERNADISSRVLAGRAGEIGRDTFIRSSVNDRSRNY